ncbi:MAG: hypothetical protein ABI927_06975 [Gaiellaceae bacterium]
METSEAPTNSTRGSIPPLRLGMLVAFVTLAFAGVVGVISVIAADDTGSAVGQGAGIAFSVFLAGATMACALACLVRRRVQLLALLGLGVSGLIIDLEVLGVWQNIDSEAYGKIAGISAAWALFALIALGLTLAVGETFGAARFLYLASLVATAAGGLIAAWLIVTAGNSIVDPGSVLRDDSALLRLLGILLVLMAVTWFAALAASRIERTVTR